MELKRIESVRFDELTHSYLLTRPDGSMALLKGVTTLMREHGLSPDYSGIDPAVLRRAAERGTAVHRLLQDYDDGRAAAETPELKAYRRLGLKVIASEYLVSDGERVASSIDKVIYVDESTVDLGDVKTTSELHTDAVAWQLSIYRWLFRLLNPGITVRKLYGIHVRDGRARLVEVEPVPPERVAALMEAEAAGRRLEAPAGAEAVLTAEEGEALVSASLRIEGLKAAIRELEAARAAAADKVAAWMEANRVPELRACGCVLRLKASYETERLDSKRLRDEDPDTYAKYVKKTRVKPSVMVKND